MLSQFAGALGVLPRTAPESTGARPTGASAGASRVTAGTSINAMTHDERVDLVALALSASAFQEQDTRPVPLDEDLPVASSPRTTRSMPMPIPWRNSSKRYRRPAVARRRRERAGIVTYAIRFQRPCFG